MKLSTQQKQTIRDLYTTHTNKEIGDLIGAPSDTVKFQLKRMGLTRPAGFLTDFQKRNTGGMATRLMGGMVRNPPGTVAWLTAGGDSEGPEWHIYRGRGHPVALKRHLWELHVGTIPAGCIIRYRDGNPRRCVLTNLECISRAENAQRNRNDAKRSETYRNGGYADSYYAGHLFFRKPDVAAWALQNTPELIAAYKMQLRINYELNRQAHE